MGDPSRGVLSPIGTVNRRRELIATGIACVSAVLGAAYTMRYGFAPSPASAPLGVHVVRTSTLIISAAGLLAATTIKWSELRTRRTLGDIYREAKAGRLRMSPYRAIAGPVSLVLMVVGVYLAISGD
jgi:hypothetical protein